MCTQLLVWCCVCVCESVSVGVSVSLVVCVLVMGGVRSHNYLVVCVC